MSSYYVPDITGQNPDYLQANVPHYVRQLNGKIFFEGSPVFVSSIHIALTDGSGDVLVKNTDWSVADADVDEVAMSQAFLSNPNFSGLLVKSVTITTLKGVGKVLSATAQQFKLTVPGRNYDNGTPFEITPDYLKDLGTGLADVRQQIARVTSPVAPNDHAPTLLPFDINKALSSNAVVNEIITVNTVAGAKVIRLTQGSFFADSLRLEYNDKVLNPSTDYFPVMLSPLTKQSTNTGGIYQYIYLNKTIAGDVTVNYHAVGGEVQIDDLNAVYDALMGIKNYLSEEIFITKETVVETPAFRAINARLGLVENNVRNLVSGNPTYEDATGGSSVRRPISSNDANFHWWTIATLYQVAGSTDVITTDRFRGRVFLPGSKIALSFSADVNLNQSRQPISFRTESLVFDPTYTLFDDLSVNAPVYPLIRLVWGQAAQTFSGACLQIGLPLPILADQLVVEDLSTVESCWILSKSTTPTPLDNNFTLPDGQTMWSSGGSSSKAVVCVPQYTQGYLVYSGSTVPLSTINTNNNTESLFTIALPAYFPTNKATSLVVTLAAANSSIIYDVEIPLPMFNAGVKSGRASFVNAVDESMVMTAKLSQTSQGLIKLALNSKNLNTASSGSLSDIIRYVRVKV